MPWKLLTDTIECLGINGTFRGCYSAPWLPADPMTWQRSGEFARALRAKGVKSIAVGDLTEEWYLYSIAHPIRTKADVVENLDRYYPAHLVQRILEQYAWPSKGGLERLFGEVLSDGQVHVPVRMLHRDLARVGFPVLRYEIRWTPEQLRPPGGERVSYAVLRLAETLVRVCYAWGRSLAVGAARVESGRGPD